MTGPEKTGLIYIKYTYSYYGEYLSFYTLYFNFVNFNKQLRDFCTYDEICINVAPSLIQPTGLDPTKDQMPPSIDGGCFLKGVQGSLNSPISHRIGPCINFFTIYIIYV